MPDDPSQEAVRSLLRAIVRRAAIDLIYQPHRCKPHDLETARALFDDFDIDNDDFIKSIADRKMSDE